jgi:4-hydroxy-tetrahydrodipicolinate synthase
MTMTTLPAMLPVRPAQTRLSGVVTALVTPFTTEGTLDEDALRRLLERQVAAGVSGISPAGTTGESPTLSAAERDRLIELCVGAVRRGPGDERPTIIAGTGTNDTAATIRATRRAAELGADAALVVAPYYNRPNQRMLEAHYLAVAEDGRLPIVVYNVPSRTASNVEARTLVRIAEHPRVIGVKEASGNLDQISTIVRERPDDLAVLAGDDAWTLPLIALGGDGVVSVASNQIPEEMVRLCGAALTGDYETARAINHRWLPLFAANFVGAPNPAPVKAALAMMGLISDELRLPLLPLDDATRRDLAGTLEACGVDLAATAGAAR